MDVGLLSALAANRKQYFDLIEAAERQFNCDIDELALESEIDGSYPDRDSLNEAEAKALLMSASRPKKINDEQQG